MKYNIYIILSLIGSLLVSTSIAQDSILQAPSYSFKVRNAKMEIRIHEPDSVLYTDHKNVFQIEVLGKNKLRSLVLEGGTIRKAGKYFIATVSEGIEAVLVIYVIKPNGKIELGLSKTYPIVKLDDPVPMIGRVHPDSIIYREDALERGYMYSKLTRFGETYVLPIISFDLQIFARDTTINLHSQGNKFSPKIQRHIQLLKDGTPLNFTNIYCLMPNGTPRKLDDTQFFVDCSGKYPTGR